MCINSRWIRSSGLQRGFFFFFNLRFFLRGRGNRLSGWMLTALPVDVVQFSASTLDNRWDGMTSSGLHRDRKYVASLHTDTHKNDKNKSLKNSITFHYWGMGGGTHVPWFRSEENLWKFALPSTMWVLAWDSGHQSCGRALAHRAILLVLPKSVSVS